MLKRVYTKLLIDPVPRPDPIPSHSNNDDDESVHVSMCLTLHRRIVLRLPLTVIQNGCLLQVY